MLVREQKQAKKGTGVFISLTIHAILVALLFLALTEKRLASDFFARQEQPFITDAMNDKKAEKDSTQEESPSAEESSVAKAMEDKKTKPTLNQPFVVPAPVVFYGNQAMMNKPVPISGSSEGKSAFEHSPSTLPTPSTAAIAPERTHSISAPQSLIAKTMKDKQEQEKIEETKELQEMTSVAESSFTETLEELKEQEPDLQRALHQGEGTLLLAPDHSLPKAMKDYAALEKQTTQEIMDNPTHKKQSLITNAMENKPAKKLTLADLFKDATNTIASFAQDGLPSARKAGTEGGDDQGSGHQITIKEGDMKYYTLWANFLNHLNQAARFNRRGQEGMIQTWINNREIQYILQCGITIDTQGKILDIDIMVSSGCPGFDKLCISDIRSAVPYPPLPEHLGKKTARFEVNVYP